MDEQDLERMLRDGLEARAADADVSPPVVARARAAVGRRRRTRWTVGVAAAAAVVVAGGVAVAAVQGEDPPPGRDREVADTGEVPQDWRTEHWGDLAVDVPAGWGYGGAPVDGSACYPEAAVGPDGAHVDEPTLGWVGRPVALTDVCAAYPWIEDSPQEEPAAPYVWLGAEVETGTVRYADGFVQETVATHGTTLTVGSDDAALRQRILDSARGGETCLSEIAVGGDISHDPATDPRARAAGVNVCAYRADDVGSGTATLTYAARLGRSAARAYLRALEGGKERDACPTVDYVETDWVVLEIVDADGGVLRQDVVHLACPGIEVGVPSLLGDTRIPLTEPMITPWAVGGIPAVVHSDGTEPWGYEYFIGPQG